MVLNSTPIYLLHSMNRACSLPGSSSAQAIQSQSRTSPAVRMLESTGYPLKIPTPGSHPSDILTSLKWTCKLNIRILIFPGDSAAQRNLGTTAPKQQQLLGARGRGGAGCRLSGSRPMPTTASESAFSQSPKGSCAH